MFVILLAGCFPVRPGQQETETPTAGISTSTSPTIQITSAAATQEPVQIGLYDTLELVFTASLSPDNPFDTYLLRLEIHDPTGKTFLIDGFYDGDGRGGQEGRVWKARLTPYMPGRWTWRTVEGDQPDPELFGLSGEIECLPGENSGGVVRQGKYFALQNGEPIYLVGHFLDLSGGLPSTHIYMSETLDDDQRKAVLERQRDFHSANKANLYIANRGDYDDQPVTPWVGSAARNDKTQMDLRRWTLYDGYIQQFKENRMLAELWFFADDSRFRQVSEADKRRLVRYTLARTSAFSHTMYVIALEWQEDWMRDEVTRMGNFIQQYNPWGRPVSVHGIAGSGWEFGGESWADFIASQAGNNAPPRRVNRFASGFWSQYDLPHLSEEFGILNSDSDPEQRARLWANFTGGAAGSGTGSDLQALQRFLAESRIPFQRMTPANELASDGGQSQFVLAEAGHHYLVYTTGGPFSLEVQGQNLNGRWFDPRSPGAWIGSPFAVSAGTQSFTPPEAAGEQDLVLWISDGSQLNPGVTHPSTGSPMLSLTVTSD
ncbi:MAG: DUF5060 domain-containing protein [Chloroflexi bacterium]|nr:DUF5060 domain-containing protein [Chloroflexota bacterium]